MHLLLADVSAGAEPASLGFWTALALVVLPGAFGGALTVLNLIDLPRLVDPTKKVGIPDRGRICGALVVGAAGGIGGALAAVVVGVWTQKLDFESSTRNCLFLVGLSVVAGFLGFKLLKQVATNFEKSLRDSENRLAEQNEVERNQLIEDEAVITQGLSLFRRTDAPRSDIEGVLEEMQKLLSRRQTDRRVGIVMGNLYDKIGAHDEAVAVVTRVLEAREAAGLDADKQHPDRNCADLRYNRACYRMPVWSAEKDPAKKNQLKALILEDLKRSIDGAASNCESAREDDDFKPLRDDPDFRAIVGAA